MTTNFYTQVMPFFGYDGRGSQFINLNYKGTDYERPINNSSYPDTIKGEALYQLMICKNYKSKNSTQSDNDIHQDFVDFIIRLAISHRSFDTPSISDEYIIQNKIKIKELIDNKKDGFYKKNRYII